MDDTNTNPFSPYIHRLPKLANYVVGFTLVCYMAGFAISNIYLGSLGIVNLDVLRTRYILVGLLFLLFLGAVAYLIAGLYHTIGKYYDESLLNLISKVFQYSFINLGVMYFVVLAIIALSGSANGLPVGLPRISQPIAWSAWFSRWPAQLFVASVFTIALIVLTFTVIVAAVIVINPKDKAGIRTPRRQKLGELSVELRRDGKKVLGILLTIFLVVFMLLSATSVLYFLSFNRLAARSMGYPVFSGGWGRYLGGISLVYGFVALSQLGIIAFRKLGKSNDASKEDMLSPLSAIIVLVAIAVSFIVPLYANGIYPSLPQQVGGGQVIKVELRISDVEVRPLILNPVDEVYLIDRTNSSTLLLLVDKSSAKYQAVEIPTSSIQSIIYNAAP